MRKAYRKFLTKFYKIAYRRFYDIASEFANELILINKISLGSGIKLGKRKFGGAWEFWLTKLIFPIQKTLIDFLNLET
ncbi:MAG: hypothetical protein ACTSRH_19235 [Promethearchaeota archaeon]